MITRKTIMASGAAPGNYFGEATDGDVTISSNTNISVTQDTGVAIKHYGSLTVDSGYTLTTDNRCKAFLIYVDGNLIVDGTISMSARGANATATGDTDISRFTESGSTDGTTDNVLFPDETNQPTSGGGNFSKFVIPQVGAASNSAGSGGQTGGGGSGGYSGGAGATGTAFGGGPGGGGSCYGGSGATGTANGGQGGNGANAAAHGDTNIWNGGAGGGAGNAGGSGGSPWDGPTSPGTPTAGGAGSSGTGGVLLIVCSGNVTIGASGMIEANGTQGGSSGNHHPYSGAICGSGGGSAGGSIVILHGGTYTNNGSVVANGGGAGALGARGTSGGAGGAGSIQVSQVLV